MYQYQFYDDNGAKADEENTAKKKLLEELREIENASGTKVDLPQKPEYTQKTPSGLTDEQIEQQAKATAEANYAAEKLALEQQTEGEKSAYEKQGKDAVITEKQLIESLEQAYDSAKTQAEKQALSRGLARSSIVMEQLEEYDQERLKEQAKVKNNYAEKLADINREIAALDLERQKAIGVLDLKKAAAVTETIRALTAERDANLEKVLEYNNALAEKEAAYGLDRADTALDYAKYYDTGNGVSSDEAMRLREQKINAAIRYYDAMDPSAAYEELLGDNEMRAALGSAYSYVLSRYRGK